MESDRTYNGWSNYETWVTKLWMDNDEGTYNHWQESARAMYGFAEPTAHMSKADVARHDLADRLESEHSEFADAFIDGKPACVFTDLLRSALGAVNWHEIAESLLSELPDDDEGAHEIRFTIAH